MPTVASIHSDVRSLLNDTFGDMFTDAILLPFTKKAYKELQNELMLNGLGDTKEETADIALAAGATTVAVPADLVVPVALFYEDADGKFIEFTERYWEPGTAQQEIHTFWRWEENEIKVLGAIPASTVRVKYIKFLPVLVDTTSNILVLNADVFLAARIAAIAAATVGNNPDRAKMHNSDANDARKVLIDTLVKRAQNNPTRRQPFRQ
jgi:hypothetical protein